MSLMIRGQTGLLSKVAPARTVRVTLTTHVSPMAIHAKSRLNSLYENMARLILKVMSTRTLSALTQTAAHVSKTLSSSSLITKKDYLSQMMEYLACVETIQCLSCRTVTTLLGLFSLKQQ